MKNFLFLLLIAIAGLVVACGDSSEIGSSISDSHVEMIVDTSFALTGEPVEYPVVIARTASQLLGSLDAANYGSLSSEVVMQMVPTANIADITEDRIERVTFSMLIVANTGFVGDSLVPMRANLYRLNTPLTTPIYSDFSVVDYYDEKNDFLGSASYSASDVEKIDSVRLAHIRTSYDAYYNATTTELREVSVELDKSFALKLITDCKEHPEYFSDVRKFTNYFPGFYVANSFGKGRMMNFYNSFVEMKYHTHTTTTAGKDSVFYTTQTLMSSGPEVITTNLINLTLDKNVPTWVDAGKAMLVAPVGYNVRFRFPAREIIAKHKLTTNSLSVINTVQVQIPVEKINNIYNLDPPTNVLVVKTSQKDSFFEKKKLADNIDSFLATYDSANKCYYVAGMRNYLVDIVYKEGKDIEDDEDFTIIPVDLTQETNASSSSYYYQTEATYTTVKVAPMVSKPAIAMLHLDKARVQMVISRLGK